MTTDPTVALARIWQMADAWEQRLPETIRTATAVDAIRTVLESAVVPVSSPPADRAATPVCICGHPEQRHFEDVCQTCGCGDYLEPRDAAEVIARWRTAALNARADRAAVLHAAADALPEADLPFVSPMGRRQTAEWLRRMADETPAAEVQSKSCVHCGQPVSRVIGTLTAWWVHAPGGNTVCHPEQAGSSPRATPKPAAEAECTCADAGASFAPAGHYADCPAAETATEARP